MELLRKEHTNERKSPRIGRQDFFLILAAIGGQGDVFIPTSPL